MPIPFASWSGHTPLCEAADVFLNTSNSPSVALQGAVGKAGSEKQGNEVGGHHPCSNWVAED